MWKIIPFSLLQSILLTVGQLLFKLALDKTAPYEGWQKLWNSFKHTWWMWHGCGIALICATLLWAYILRHFPFSIAYPLSCLSFVFGMLGAWVFLGETIPAIRWVGIALILLGAVFIAK